MIKRTIKQAIHAPSFLNEPIEYNHSFSRGIKVNIMGATVLFISGTASIDRRGKTVHLGDIIAQTRRTYKNLTGLLKSEGASWHEVVQTRCYLKDMRDYDKFNQVRNSFFRKQRLRPFPASVCIEANLCRSNLLVEIEAIAIINVR